MGFAPFLKRCVRVSWLRQTAAFRRCKLGGAFGLASEWTVCGNGNERGILIGAQTSGDSLGVGTSSY